MWNFDSFRTFYEKGEKMKLINSIWRYKSIIIMIMFITLVFSLSSVNAFTPNPPNYLCYQETANVSTSCGGLNTGTYEFYNGTYSGGAYAYMIVNYTKPNNIINTSNWRISYFDNRTDNETNFTLPQSCFNYQKLRIKVYSNVTDVGGGNYDYKTQFTCYDGSTWQNIKTPMKATFAVTYSETGNSLKYLIDGNWDSGVMPQINGNGFSYENARALHEEAMNYNITALIENNQTYNQNVFETNTEQFTLNVSYDNSYYSSISATFNYNGTSYSSSKTTNGNNVVFI